MEKTDNRNVLDELKQYSSSPALEAEFLTGRAGAAKSRSYLFNNMKTPFLILIISCAVFVAPLFTYAVILDKNVYVGDEPIILQACTQSGNELDGVIIYDLTNGDVLGSIACGFSIGFDLRQINWNLLFPVFHEYSIIEITKNDACEDPDILTYEQCKALKKAVAEFRFAVRDPSSTTISGNMLGPVSLHLLESSPSMPSASREITPPPSPTAEVVQTTPLPAPSAEERPLEVPPVSKFFYKDLFFGIRQSDVGRLQEFLAQDKTIYPEGFVTGYFGPLTQKAVERFQAIHDIVSSGTPQTTGFGRLGPLTRAKLNELIRSSAKK